MEFLSQVGQDRWICETLGYKRNGFFIDAGAGDGKYISNTYYLEKELGWKGICMDADPIKFAELKKNRKCLCIEAAIYSRYGFVDFAESTKNKIWGIKDTLQEDSGDGVSVEVCSLASILDLFYTPDIIDYVSIDLEGADYEALLGFPFDKHEVRLWTIEHNAYLDGGLLRDKIRELMLSKGYRYVENLEDRVTIFEDWWYNPKYVTL